MMRDPATLAADALLMLETGRTGMARAILEPLPQLIRATMRTDRDEYQAITAEVARLKAERTRLADEVWRERRALKGIETSIARRRGELTRLGAPQSEPGSRVLKPHERLAEALGSGRITPEAAAEVLRVRPEAIERLAQGRSSIGSGGWERLWQAIKEQVA